MGVTLVPDTFSNFASSALAGGAGGVSTPLNSTDLTIHVAAGTGSLFPSTYPFRIIINPNSLSAAEIVIATASAGADAFTITRHAEGTSSPASWAVGTTLIHGGTAANWSNIWTALSNINLTNGGTVSGTLTISSGGVVVTGSSSITGGTLTLPGSVSVDTSGNVTTGGTYFWTKSQSGANQTAIDLNPSGGATHWQIQQDTTGNIWYYNATASANRYLFGNDGTFSTGADVVSGGKFRGTSGALVFQAGGSTGNAAFGFKTSGGSRIFEIPTSGNPIAGGSIYQGATGAPVLSSGSVSFDSFDYGEAYPMAEVTTLGTVVCAGVDGLMHRCTHEGCHAALVVSRPGYSLGYINGDELITDDDEKLIKPLALVGRVQVQTSDTTIAPRTLTMSDGAGGVRAMRAGEAGFSLGSALSAPQGGFVLLLLRPLYCVAP